MAIAEDARSIPDAVASEAHVVTKKWLATLDRAPSALATAAS